MVLLSASIASCGSRQESSVAESHIDANMPVPGDLHAILKRDLLAYFSTLSSIRVTDVSITVLRNEPAQSGVAYPKYYAWVVLRSDDGATRSGAVRVAAIEKTSFEVTDFLSKEALLADPAAVTRVFPSELVPDINKRALE